jgi:3-methyladenine DNA glycosylase AlkD
MIIKKIRVDLLNNVDEKTKLTGQNFFKEEIKAYGVKMPVVAKIAKENFVELKHKTVEEVFNLCDELWQSGFIEESIIACNWSYYLREKYLPEHFARFEQWISGYVTNWATCDTLCNHTIGDFVLMYPSYVTNLKGWAKSENRWMRRAAAVTLIIPARKGKFLNDIIDIANTLLLDSDDLVQKGYGWMLKAASEAHQKEVFDFVISKKSVMPRTALRYAIEKMPEDLRREAMKK